MPLLALDVGNSSVKAAVWDGGAWSPVTRFPADDADGAAWAERLAPWVGADAVGVASVVPRVTGPLAAAARAVTGAEPVVVSAALPLPFRMAYRTPRTLGADRLAAAVAAWALGGGRAVVALDAGTAITTDVVTAEPAYLGGAIAPGPDLLRRALARDTGQLPETEWTAPASPVGASTAEAVQAGLSVMVLDGVAGLLRRTLDAVGGDALVVATGGWAPWLAGHLAVDRVEPTLVLDGVRRLTAASGRGPEAERR